jgi:hypothetical protein
MKEPLKPPYISLIDKRGEHAIWIVDGSYIRGHIDEEFTNFGQHYKYSYIPEKELWLDQEAHPDERQFFIEHLLIEYRLMKKGMPYEDALVEADKYERKERRRAGDLRKATKRGQVLPNGKEVCLILILQKAGMTRFMNLFRKMKYGLMMI